MTDIDVVEHARKSVPSSSLFGGLLSKWLQCWGFSQLRFITVVTMKLAEWVWNCSKIISSKGLQDLFCWYSNLYHYLLLNIKYKVPLCFLHYWTNTSQTCTIQLVTQNLFPQASYSFTKLWITGIGSVMDFKGNSMQ